MTITLEYLGYYAEVDDCFYGTVVNTNDVITFQGNGYTDVANAFIDSVEDYFDFCKSRGEKPETPKEYNIEGRS
jgi:predicted HicB family RNase H-like nuclease